jgi:hypothetical protein
MFLRNACCLSPDFFKPLRLTNQALHHEELHGVMYQTIELLVTTGVRTSNPTQTKLFVLHLTTLSVSKLYSFRW